MRQFLFGKNVAYSTVTTSFNDIPTGAFGIYLPDYDSDGALQLVSDGTEVKTIANLVLGRAAADGGPVVIPISKRDFKYVHGKPIAATKFKATVTIPDNVNVGTYAIMMVKKGKLFNDRHKWTTDIYVRDISTTPADIAKKLTDQFNLNQVGIGCKATVEGKVITIEALNEGEDYNVVCCDELMGVKPVITTSGLPAYGDMKHIIDLACQAASEAGFEYTFEEDIKMYPSYPLEPNVQYGDKTTKYDIFTLTFYEGRINKNLDEVTRQIVQIVVPTGSDCIATLDTIFKNIEK